MIAGAESLVRCAPGEDGTNGFFVSMFVRSQTGDNVHGAAGQKRKATSEDNGLEQPPVKRKKKKKKTKPSET